MNFGYRMRKRWVYSSSPNQSNLLILGFFPQLEPHKNLVDQCVKGEGLVQINAQVRTHTRRINIVDVLKPTDDALAEISQMMGKSPAIETDETSDTDSPSLPSAAPAVSMAVIKEMNSVVTDEQNSFGFDNCGNVGNKEPPSVRDDATRSVTAVLSMDEEDDDDDSACDESLKPQTQPAKPQWIIDTQFRKDQMRLKISDDPREWTVAQVKHWLQWAVRQFNLVIFWFLFFN